MATRALEVGSWVEDARKTKGGSCGVIVAVGLKGGYVEVLLVNVLHLCTHGSLRIHGQEKMKISKLRPFQGTGKVGRAELNRLFAEGVATLDQGEADEEELCHFSAASIDHAASGEDALPLAPAAAAVDEQSAAIIMSSEQAFASDKAAEGVNVPTVHAALALPTEDGPRNDESHSRCSSVADARRSIADMLGLADDGFQVEWPFGLNPLTARKAISMSDDQLCDIINAKFVHDNASDEPAVEADDKGACAVIFDGDIAIGSHDPEVVDAKFAAIASPDAARGRGVSTTSSLAETPPKKKCRRSLERPATKLAPKEMQQDRISFNDELSKQVTRLDCALRVQYFMNGKNKEIKCKRGFKRQQVWLQRNAADTVTLVSDGLTNNVRLPLSSARQVFPPKDMDRLTMVFETGMMAFYVTVAGANSADLHRLVDAACPHLPSSCEVYCE